MDQRLGDRRGEALATAAFLAVCALFLFVDARPAPFVLWDESRNVVNALEMRRAGFGLVTTYGFAPDLWNTKPPLLIWLMFGSMKLFGASEWALRLPSAVAALGTLLILVRFVRRLTGSLGTAMLAATMLMLSPGFFGESGARTADYDSLLLFFTTFYLQRLFLAVHRARPGAAALAGTGGLIAGATMTKSIAGLIPGSGVAVHLLVTGRWRRVARDWRGYAGLALIAIAPLLIFYAAREASRPGYLAAVLHNDLFGRFHQTLIGKTTSPLVYVEELMAGWFAAGPFLFVVALAWRRLVGKARLLCLYSLCVAGTLILVYTASSTRLVHYVLPAFPWLATAVAVSLRALAGAWIKESWRRRGWRPRLVAAAAGGASVLMLGQAGAQASHWRYQAFPERQFYPQASYGQLFATLRARGVSRLTVVDSGMMLEGRPHYQPLLAGYRLLWAERGLRAELAFDVGPGLHGMVASCDPVLAGRLWGKGSRRTGSGCVVARLD